MDKIKNWIDTAHRTVKDAINGNSKSIAYHKRAFGKKCSRQFVESQGVSPETVRSNFYENFLRWIAAIYYANQSGFELLWIDLELFVRELRRSQKVGGTVFPSREQSLISSLVKIRLETSKLFELIEER